MKHVRLVLSVGELLLGCLLVASFTMGLTQGQQLPHPSASSSSSSSKRAELLHSSALAASKPTMAELLSADSDRISFIKGKLNAGGNPAYGQVQSSIQAPLYSGQTIGSPNYIVKVGLGTPAKDLYLIIDTGSGLTWTQCLPCGSDCYSQKDPIFDPSASSSYKQVPCASAQCMQLSSSASSGCSSAKCEYVIFYLDGSYTMGDFALETLSVGGKTIATAFPFGCGHQNTGLFHGSGGIMGLSRDSIAFPAQTKAAFGEVFAYCMPPIFSSSAGYIEFGAGSRGPSTPLVELRSTLYVVELEGVQVEGTSSIAKPPTSKETIVDSGTVITRLDTPLYEQVRDAFKKAASSLKEAPSEAGMGVFDTCYIASATSVFPRITFTFAGGLVFTPGAQTSVILIDDKDTYCLALLPLDSSSGLSIFGNFQQQGHLVTYDIAHSTISISSSPC